jgi:tetratricopeptide (TPR) repeat protein
MKAYDEAVEQYSIVVKMEPGNASAHNAIAIGYYMLKQYDLAYEHAAIAKELGFKVQKELLEANK